MLRWGPSIWQDLCQQVILCLYTAIQIKYICLHDQWKGTQVYGLLKIASLSHESLTSSLVWCYTNTFGRNATLLVIRKGELSPEYIQAQACAHVCRYVHFIEVTALSHHLIAHLKPSPTGRQQKRQRQRNVVKDWGSPQSDWNYGIPNLPSFVRSVLMILHT